MKDNGGRLVEPSPVRRELAAIAARERFCVDGTTEEYMSDVGPEIALERAHSKWFNLEV